MSRGRFFYRAGMAAFLAGWFASLVQAEKLAIELPDLSRPTDQLLVRLEGGIDPHLFARQQGLWLLGALRSDAQSFVFSAGTVDAADQARARLNAAAGVLSAYSNRITAYQQMSFTPNDVYFFADSGFSGSTGQWTLSNSFTPGLDVRIMPAWASGFTGQGVVIGIVDDSFEINHEDLAPNYNAELSFNFGSYVSSGPAEDPSPVNADDRHGVAVAGIAAARGGNTIGVTGAAPFAQLAGLRIDFPNQTTAMFVDADQYRSGEIAIKNHSYGISAPYVDSTPERLAIANSAAGGTIDVVAAGNERFNIGGNTNTKMLQSSPDAIVVAALSAAGTYASYSNFGASVTVTAPSNGASGFGVTTTDRYQTGNGYNTTGNGDGDKMPDPAYTTIFGGTSAATPLVAGILALVKEAQPALDTRMTKHLLARTSIMIDPGDSSDSSAGGWRTNAAGIHFNPNYGFGLINASALVAEARNYAGVTALITEQVALTNVNLAIPDDNAAGVTAHFVLQSTTPLEEILVTLNIADHTWRGDLEADLISPSGMVSRLIDRSDNIAFDNGDEVHWQFLSNAFWGENPHGQWTINVRDVAGLDLGSFASFSVLARMGSLVPIGGGAPGDFNFDSIVNAVDIDLLIDHLNDTDPIYDLNGDGNINIFDFYFMLSDILHRRQGDADLDGDVDVSDLAILRTHLGDANAGWAMGDFTADGLIDVGDLSLLRDNLGLPPPGFESPSSGSAFNSPLLPVPEPASALPLLFTLLLAPLRSRPRI